MFSPKINKKAVSITATTLTKLIFVLVAGIILFAIVAILFSDNSDIESALAVCRTSVDAREMAAGKTLGSARSSVPMLCKTHDIIIPEKKYHELAEKNFSKAVMMNIIDRSMDCWWQFGEGMYDKNIFSGWGFFSKNQCFACFTFTIKYPENPVTIYIDMLSEFYSTEPYKPLAQHKPLCLFDEKENEGCVSRDAPECERKGGICSEGDTFLNFEKYEAWNCNKRKETCFVNPNMIETYEEYIFDKADGLFLIDPELKDVNGFNSNNSYGIGFISHTRDIATVWYPPTRMFHVADLLGAFNFLSDEQKEKLPDWMGVAQPTVLYLSTLENLDNKCSVVGDFNQ
jgi:hypothetical protein